MGSMLFSVYSAILAGLVLAGLSSALRQRRPDLSLDKVLLGMENLGTFLLQEQRKVKQLQRTMSEVQEESELQHGIISRLQTELSRTNEKLLKLELDSGSCHCSELVNAFSFLKSNQLPSIEQELRLEKVNRHRLENVVENIKAGQEVNLIRSDILDEKLADLQSNVSLEQERVIRTLKTRLKMRQKINLIKFEAINEKLVILQTNLTRENANRDNLKIQFLKYSQQDNLMRWETMDEKFMSLQTNVSMETTKRERLEDVIEILNITQEDTRIKWQSLDERFTDLRTNVHRKICPTQFTKLETGCYFMYSHQVAINPDRARAECERRNASLVSVDTVAEKDAIQRYLQTETDVPRHIGIVTSGRRISGEWHWTGNKKQSIIISLDVLKNWGPGQPTGDDQDCLGLWWSRNDFFWYDFTCTSRYSRRVMCEL